MYIVIVIAAVLIGAVVANEEGALVGVALGFLLAEVRSLRNRVRHLERQVKAGSEPPAAEVVFTPVSETGDGETEPIGPQPASGAAVLRGERTVREPGPARDLGPAPPAKPSRLDQFAAKIGDTGQNLAGTVSRFLTGGNPVLKGGLVILFFGVAFLVKYAAQHNLVPIEFRLAGAALGGMALMLIGWRLRHKAAGYGLTLQGGGVGVLYLVVYGAAKLYGLAPLPVAFGLMVALVALSGLLAVLQDGRMLAVFGAAGGFLAPVLMSTGSGSHVALFSYFALLNAGIFGIAWYKAWRELNLLGFFFTFGIGTLWGYQGYQPHHFASTEPFLLLFFSFYAAISVLFAHRQPVNLRGFIDGPLVFGLPLVVTGLQYALVKDFRYGMALSACGFGVFYLLLATFLWRRLAGGMRMLCEAFLALGIMFATMTVPLAFDARWTTAVWALEGAAMVWVGVRQQRLLARLSGILLQLASAWVLIDRIWYPFDAIPFLNSGFFSCLFIAAAGLFSSFWLRDPAKLRRWEKYLHLPLLVWAMGWWYFGGIRECDRHFGHIGQFNGVLLFGSGSTVLLTLIASRWQWRQLAIGQAVHLVLMMLAVAAHLSSLWYSSHLLAGWGAVAWGVALYCQYRMLHHFDAMWPEKLMGGWHVATFWLVLLLACLEFNWLMVKELALAEVWGLIFWGLVPAAGVLLLLALHGMRTWPLGRWRQWYLGPGIILPLLLLALWSLKELGFAGDPVPLPYIPLINPLELTLIFVIMVNLRWYSSCTQGHSSTVVRMPVQLGAWLAVLLIFLLANGAVARAVHFYGNIPYTATTLHRSVVFQAAIAALWSFGALSLTVWAARAGNRLVWCCGAGLLGLVVMKLFVVDLAGTGTIARIVSFIVVGILMLVIGYFSPIPPARKEEKK